MGVSVMKKSERPANPAASQDDIGDTDRLVTGRDNSPQAQAGDVTEILDAVNATIAADLVRTDLWMMRFEILATLGLKAEFTERMTKAWGNPTLRSTVDWAAVQLLWERVAPRDPLPQGMVFPKLKRPSLTAHR